MVIDSVVISKITRNSNKTNTEILQLKVNLVHYRHKTKNKHLFGLKHLNELLKKVRNY